METATDHEEGHEGDIPDVHHQYFTVGTGFLKDVISESAKVRLNKFVPRNVNGELFFTVISKELNPEMRDTSLGNGQGRHFGWPFFKFQKNLILSKRGQVLILSC